MFQFQFIKMRHGNTFNYLPVLTSFYSFSLVYDRNRFGIGFRPNFGHFGRISVWPKWKKCFRYWPKQKFCIGSLPKNIWSQIAIQFGEIFFQKLKIQIKIFVYLKYISHFDFISKARKVECSKYYEEIIFDLLHFSWIPEIRYQFRLV